MTSRRFKSSHWLVSAVAVLGSLAFAGGGSAQEGLQFTAAAVMQLVETGTIGLDDSITDYLPDYPQEAR